ncbi:MAG: DNA methyltransferase [Phycisphaerales bacterium]
MPRPHAGSRRPEPPREPRSPAPGRRPPLSIATTTLWEYPSQHYDAHAIDAPDPAEVEVGDSVDSAARLADEAASRAPQRRDRNMQGDRGYVGATPSWVIWQLLQRYTRPKALCVDPMAGSGTSLDVARDLGRRALGYDLRPTRKDIFRADARSLPLEDSVADFAFVDPPYSTHVDYSDDPRCIGKLDAGGGDRGVAYYEAMRAVIGELFRVLKPGRVLGLYVSDSYRRRRGAKPGEGLFMPIGFELFSIMRERFEPLDIVSVVRHNAKLDKGNWRRAAEEQNFFLRGFNYLFIMRKPLDATPSPSDSTRSRGGPSASPKKPRDPRRGGGADRGGRPPR